jgi:thioredoxin-like negative regulator of GroEL
MRMIVSGNPNIGGTVEAGRRAAEVRAVFEPLLAARSGDVDLRLRLADRQMQKGDAGFAIDLLQQAVRIDPSHAGGRAALADLQRRAPR